MDDEIGLDDKPELNITPLVDIMLVLLAILMVTTPAVVYKEDINLPDGSKTNRVEVSEILTVRIDKSGKVYVDKDIFTFNEFKSDFRRIADKYDKTKSVYIYADKSLLYGDVVPIFAELKRIGFTKVSLGTQ